MQKHCGYSVGDVKFGESVFGIEIKPHPELIHFTVCLTCEVS